MEELYGLSRHEATHVLWRSGHEPLDNFGIFLNILLLLFFCYRIDEQFGFARSGTNEFTLQARADVSMIWSIRCWVLLSLPCC